MSDAKTCPSCGARLPEGTERCTLCGTPVARERGEAGAQKNTDATGEEAAGAEKTETRAGAFCNECGWKNPPEANFCSRCGHRLQHVTEASTLPVAASSTPPGTKPADGPPAGGAEAGEAAPSANSDELGRRVALVTGVAVLVVAGLFLLSTWSTDSGDDTSEASAARSGEARAAAGARGGPAASSTNGDPTRRALPDDVRGWADADLPSAIDEDADSLAAKMQTQSGAAKQQTRRRQVRLLIGGGRPDRAALAQWKLARSTGATEDWRRAGDLLMQWAGNAERTQQPRLADLAVGAYRRVLADTPDDPDVRLSLASAYVTTNNPMRGISEIKSILEDHPDHLRTRMAYGMLQLQIGRSKAALEQFERVQATAGEDSPLYRQAGDVIEEIKRQSNGAPTDAPLPSSRAPGADGSSSTPAQRGN